MMRRMLYQRQGCVGNGTDIGTVENRRYHRCDGSIGLLIFGLNGVGSRELVIVVVVLVGTLDDSWCGFFPSSVGRAFGRITLLSSLFFVLAHPAIAIMSILQVEERFNFLWSSIGRVKKVLVVGVVGSGGG